MSAPFVYSPPDLRWFALSPERFLVRNPLSGAAQIVDANERRALSLCTETHSIAKHAQQLAEAGYAPRAVAEEQLRRWAQAGILINVEDVVGSMRTAAAGMHAREAASTICIPTADRSETLVRALKSYHLSDPSAQFCIGDDGVAPNAADRTLAALRSVGIRNQSLFVINRATRQNMVEQLAKASGVDAGIVSFGLHPKPGVFASYGANRNAMMLAMAGRMVVFADDDTFAPLTQVPSAAADGAAVCLSSDPHVVQSRFPASGSESFPDLERFNGSLCGAHNALLGKTASEWLAVHDVELMHAGAGLLERARRSTGRVRVTQLGSMGDSGTGTLAHYLLLQGRSRQLLFEDEDRYDWAHRSRQVNVHTSRPLVTDGVRCMSMALGLDATDLLAPFSPLLRNADGVFGVTTFKCCAEMLFGWAPAIVQHRPPTPRRTNFEESLEEMRGVDANDLLARLISAAVSSEPSLDAAFEMRRLGETLSAWAAEPLPVFEARLRRVVLRTRAADVRQLRQLLVQHDHEPFFWAQDVQRALMVLEEAMLEEAHCWPRDMVAKLGPDTGRSAFRDYVCRYGELLRCWPALFDTAKTLWPDLAAVAERVGD